MYGHATALDGRFAWPSRLLRRGRRYRGGRCGRPGCPCRCAGSSRQRSSPESRGRSWCRRGRRRTRTRTSPTCRRSRSSGGCRAMTAAGRWTRRSRRSRTAPSSRAATATPVSGSRCARSGTRARSRAGRRMRPRCPLRHARTAAASAAPAATRRATTSTRRSRTWPALGRDLRPALPHAAVVRPAAGLLVVSGWLLAGELVGRDRTAQLLAGAVCGLAPMATFVSATVSPDALIYPLWGFAFWLCARIVRGAARREVVALLLVACALAVKPVSVALLPGVLWALAWRRIPLRAVAAVVGLACGRHARRPRRPAALPQLPVAVLRAVRRRHERAPAARPLAAARHLAGGHGGRLRLARGPPPVVVLRGGGGGHRRRGRWPRCAGSTCAATRRCCSSSRCPPSR